MPNGIAYFSLVLYLLNNLRLKIWQRTSKRFNVRNCGYPTKEGTCREAKALSPSPLYDLEEVEPYLYMLDVSNVASISSGYAGGFYYTFQILYKEVRIEKHRLIVYYNDFVNTMVSLYGESLFYNDISVKPVLIKEEAKNKLKESDSQIIDEFITSEGELLIYVEKSKGVYLCYKFVVSPQGSEPYYYYISAKTGEVIAKKQDHEF